MIEQRKLKSLIQELLIRFKEDSRFVSKPFPQVLVLLEIFVDKLHGVWTDILEIFLHLVDIKLPILRREIERISN